MVRGGDSGSMLVTGATGVVGAEIVRGAGAAGWDVVGCSRRGGAGSVSWDMMNESAPAVLRRHWDVVVHAAASTRWTLPAVEAWRANVTPLDPLAELLGPGTHLVFVSTAWAIGLNGDVESPEVGDYRNTYEWSKAGAERTVRGRFGPATIIRPPLVVGRRSDGAVARFSGLYSRLTAITSGTLPALVCEKESPLEMVSSTDVVSCCLEVAAAGRPATTTVHVQGRGLGAMTVGELIERTLRRLDRWRARRGAEPLERPRLLTPEQWYRFFRPLAGRVLTRHQQRVLDTLEPFVPYMSIPHSLAVTWPVEPLEDCLDRCVDYWADRHPDRACRELTPWKAAAR
ncbi:NAD-dependent epimerase/dehydratase family protein [Rhizohabitans arisaemae]|uniref:NAD-dependent epimerase/dehydratase family protein n=1 Tax=Rhizohabitans arisaemae TaxID=2720610 RepID=UPI0024B22B30|nr:SDR family oxidoreductase [Rhizohabitans arisaemae]